MIHPPIEPLVLLLLIISGDCDIYLHNPRGSNNRLDESGRERDNDNRMFNSQNNERGGYNVGNLYYYTASKLQVEWTNQHSCSSTKANCDIILQYMCGDLIRDGSDTRTIQEVNSQCELNDCNTDFRFGMNENNKYYTECKRRTRNKGLFTDEQKLGPTAINTRQNPNGQRYGYECSEERDYYPYWHPTPWIDIAILTNNPKRCEYYRNESENFKPRWYCSVPNDYTSLIANSKDECEKIKKAVWTESKPAANLAKPICEETQYTRDNHLGNTFGGHPPVFNWTLPSLSNKKCVLRIRYNISTNEFNSSNTFQNDLNNVNNNLAKRMNLNSTDAINRGYVYKTNPSVKLFSDLELKLNLAINTAQFGRVFQDRSHVFEIRERPTELESKKIVNLNVRGKRGNIVQVYPAVEYDFVPNKLEISKDDFVHIQWTGSNKNPPNNDGQGVAGSDRSNILLLNSQTYIKGDKNFYSPLELNGQYGVNYPHHLLNSTFLGFGKEDLIKLALLNQFGGSMDELDDASTYFDLGPKKVTSGGVVYHYMSSRNNNFSNRDQKGEIIVNEFPFIEQSIGYNGGTISDKYFELTIPEGTFTELVNIRIETKTTEQILAELEILKNNDGIKKLQELQESKLASDFMVINFPKNPKNSIETTIKLINNPQLMQTTSVYRINSDYSLFTKVPTRIIDCPDKVTIDVTDSGIYIARNESSYTVLIVCLIILSIVLIVGLFASIYLWRNPKYLQRIRYSACNVKRSMSDQI